MGPRETAREILRRVRHRRQQRIGKSNGQRDAKRVTIPAAVLHRKHSRFGTDVHRNRAPGLQQLVGRLARVDATSRGNLREGQVAEPQQQVVHAVGRPRVVFRIEVLPLPFDFLDGIRVEQFAQLGFTEQLPKLGLVDRQGLRAPLRKRRIAVVDVVGDVAEQQCRGERRRCRRIDSGDRGRARLRRSG